MMLYTVPLKCHSIQGQELLYSFDSLIITKLNAIHYNVQVPVGPNKFTAAVMIHNTHHTHTHNITATTTNYNIMSYRYNQAFK